MHKPSKKPDYIFHSKEKNGVRRHTIVGIVEDDKLHIGVSVTADRDKFIKKLGRNIATGRAIKNPLKTINLLERKKPEIKVLFHDIAKNFSKTNPMLVLPNYHIGVRISKAVLKK